MEEEEEEEEKFCSRVEQSSSAPVSYIYIYIIYSINPYYVTYPLKET